MKIVYLFILFLSLGTRNINAQSFLWAEKAIGTNDDEGFKTCTDQMGNIYVVGRFFSPSITFGSITLYTAGIYDVFIVKYDALGNVIWANSAGGNSYDYGNDITVDIFGNVLITGMFMSPTIFFGTTTLINIGPAGNADFYVAKYSSTGTLIWARGAGGNSSDWGNSVSTDIAGNVYVTGDFYSNSIAFGATVLTNSGVGFADMFVAKYDTTGTPIWAKSGVGTTDDIGTGISIDPSGNVLVTGYFKSATLSLTGTVINNHSASGTEDIFVAKYNSSGAVIWAQDVGAGGGEWATSISTDDSANVIIAGYYSSVNMTIGSTTLTNAGSYDFLIFKYNSNGNAVWAKSAGGIGEEKGNCIANDAAGNSYVTGYLKSPSVTFGTITVVNTSYGSSSYETFVVKYDLAGNALWGTHTDGFGGNWGNGITADANGTVFVTGQYANTTIFGDTSLIIAGGPDYFITKLCGNNPSPPIISPSPASFCQGQNVTLNSSSATGNVWYPSGATTQAIIVNTGGIDSLTVTLANGCYSSAGVTVTVNALPIVSFSGLADTICVTWSTQQLIGLPAGGTFSGTGIIGNTFDPSISGVGNFVVTYSYSDIHGCSNSIDRIVYVDICAGINQIADLEITKIFPNPSTSTFIVKNISPNENLLLQIYNPIGKIVFSEKLCGKNEYLLRTNLSSGIYFVQVGDERKTFTQKLVVE